MNKNNITLIISDYAKSKIDWQQEAYQDGISIGIEVYEGNFMIDEHLCEKFEELCDIDIVDEAEGYSSYEGDLSAPQLVKKLISMGFNAKISE